MPNEEIEVEFTGSFGVQRGHLVRISEGYQYSHTHIGAASTITNISTGERLDLGRMGTSTPLVNYNPAILGYVEDVRKVGVTTKLIMRQTTKEVFLSYNSQDKLIAGDVKTELEKIGIRCFLAHEDIDISNEWRSVIREHLVGCALFVPVITRSFKDSAWTNQEAGFALGRNKVIASLILDHAEVPAFLSDIQGVPANSSSVASGVATMIDGLRRTHGEILEA